MKEFLQRRSFLQSLMITPILSFSSNSNAFPLPPKKEGKLRISLNAYSFNKPLSDGSMTLDELLQFCALHKIDGVDLTGYYFPGYPAVPSDEYLYNLKRKAFRLGVDITGSGIRNDFSNPDKNKRNGDIALIKNWIAAASKIGAPVLRIFTGNQKTDGYSRAQVLEWMTEDIRECVEFGRNNGVIVAIQNHNDFLQTADQTIELIKRLDSPWFGLILDIGSFRIGDPYAEIEKTIPYAVNWQIKELVYENGKETKVNLQKLLSLIKSSGYQGYLPIETLGPGDPFQKIPVFLAAVKKAIG